MKIEKDRKYFWNIVEVTIEDSLDKEEVGSVIGFHLISEYPIHGNALRKLSKKLLWEEDWVELVTLKDPTSNEISLGDFQDIAPDLLDWSVKVVSSKRPMSGEELLSIKEKLVLRAFAEVKFNFKPGGSLLYINEES